MTRKQVKRAVAARLVAAEVGAGWKQLYKIRVHRHGGRCVATVTHRRLFSRLQLASAKTWAQAERQVRTGPAREVA